MGIERLFRFYQVVTNLKSLTLILLCIMAFQTVSAQSVSFSPSPHYIRYGVDDGLPSNEVYQIVQDKDNYLWFATDRGLARYNGFEFRTYDLEDGLQSLSSFGFTIDETNRLWCYNYQNEIYYFENERFYYHPVSDQLRDFKNDKIQQITWEGDSLWITTSLHQLRWDSKTKHLEVLSARHNSNDAFAIDISQNLRLIYCGEPVNGSRDLHYDQTQRFQNPFYISTPERSFYSLPNQKEVWSYDGKTLQKKKFPYTVNHALYLDNENHLWVGTTQGVYIFDSDDTEDEFQILFPDESITSILEDNEGGFWFTTERHGVIYVRNPKIVVWNYPFKEINNNIVYLELSKDLLFFVCKKGQIFEGPPQNGSFENIGKINTRLNVYGLPGTFNSIRNNVNNSNRFLISYLHANAYYNELIRSRSDNGRLYCFRLRAGDTTKVDTILNIPSTEDNFKSVLHNDRYIYLGNQFGLNMAQINGTKLITPTDERFRVRVNFLSGYDSLCMVATGGKGLLICSDTNVIRTIDVSDGLADNFCNSVKPDEFGRVWVATNNGISVITGNLVSGDYTIRNFTATDGLPWKQMDLCLAYNGWVVGVAYNHVVCFEEASIPHKKPDFRVYLKTVSIKQTQQKNLMTKTEQFNYNENDLFVSFESVTYKYSNDLTFRYRLLGLDTSWKYTRNRSIDYTNLEPGNYTFQIQGGSIADGWSEQITEFVFIIKPPYWTRTWFLFAVAITALAMIYGLFVWRLRSIRRQERLQNQLLFYRQQALGLQMNPHFLFNSINSIQASIFKNDQRNLLNHVSSFAALIRMVFNISQKNLVPLTDEIEVLKTYLDFEKIRFKEQIDYRIDIDKSVQTDEYLIPPLMLQPLVENSIKHGRPESEAGFIQVTVSEQAGTLQIQIRDNGPGYDPDNTYKVAQAHLSSGLKLVKKRLLLLERWFGKPTSMRIQNLRETGDQGTKITLTIPKITQNNKR